MADPDTGMVRRHHRKRYSFVEKRLPDGQQEDEDEGSIFLSKLLQFDLAEMDWVSSPGGLLVAYYKSIVDAESRLNHFTHE